VRGAPTVKGVTGDNGKNRVLKGGFPAEGFHLVRFQVECQLGNERESVEKGRDENGAPNEAWIGLVELIQANWMTDRGSVATFVFLEVADDGVGAHLVGTGLSTSWSAHGLSLAFACGCGCCGSFGFIRLALSYGLCGCQRL
jgi:hypothetical protein